MGLCTEAQKCDKLLRIKKFGQVFSCAYRPEGNGSCEHNHMAIKKNCGTSKMFVEEAVYWYNVTKGKKGCNQKGYLVLTQRILEVKQQRTDVKCPGKSTICT